MAKCESVDKDLDKLLDSALDDFDKPKTQLMSAAAAESVQKQPLADGAMPVTSEVDAAKSVAQSGGGTANNDAGSVPEDESAAWKTEIEEIMKKIMDQNPLFQESLSNIAQPASKTPSATNESDSSSTFQETLDTITRAIQQSLPPAESINDGGSYRMLDLDKLLGSLGFGGGDSAAGSSDDVGGFMQMMQGVMQNLLSKELLYPALKDLTEKYPKWLVENRDKTPTTDIVRYEKQLEIMVKVCETFDEENDADSHDVRKERFEKILELMQEMQKCGNPPAELIETGEVVPGVPSGQLPNMPTPPPECSQQ